MEIKSRYVVFKEVKTVETSTVELKHCSLIIQKSKNQKNTTFIY